MSTEIKFMTIDEIKKMWPAEAVAAGIADKVSLYDQKVAEKKKPSRAELRHHTLIGELLQMLCGDQAPHVKSGRA